MSDTLEALLAQLAATKAQAEQQYAAEEYEEEYEPDFEGEDALWLGLQLDHDGVWSCGWLVRQDEATDWAIVERAATPSAAAYGLLVKLRGER